MKIHSDKFKETIKSLGRMQDVRITYTLNNKQLILDGENINSITPNYEASLLKSVMKGLDLDSNIDIPLGTEIKFEYGLLINKEYEYLNYGNYIVYSSEKQEDTLSYKITCYDKMLYSMKDYEHIDITYPCTIKQYLVALCSKIGLQFKDSDFANANRQITNELFMTINEDGTYSSMGYTYRDVLDQIAETTGGCICMTLDDKVEVRYINELYNKKSARGNPIHITDSIESELTIDKIKGSYKQDKVPSPDYPSEVETVKDNVEIAVINKNIFDGNKAVEFWKNFGAKVEFVENVFKVNMAHQSLYSKPFKLTNEIKKLTLSVGDIINNTSVNARLGLCTIKEDGTVSNRTAIYQNQTITKNANAIYFDWSKADAFTMKEIIVSVYENETTNDYVPHQSQTAIMPIQQEMLTGDYISSVEHHEWGKIENYNNEEINTEYISTTGELSQGATVYYKLETPVDLELTPEQQLVRDTKLYTYKNITNIAVSNELASLDIIYSSSSKETINEEYINDTNVNFGEKYGPINSIVLARAGESDKIYKKDQNSIATNGLCELMIKENQFMNFNDRVDYLQELSDKLFGVEYYLNDFVSTGIMYYDLLDMYNIEIFGKTYNCLMLNDEQNITQGLEENIHTDRPETSETDYKKADSTDRKINQTYLIVDKQNQKIEGVISQIGDRSEKTTTITADIDGLNSKVSNIADLTETTSGVGTLTLDNCANGELLQLNIYGNNTVFKPLVLSDDLYLSDSLI
nr:MAG TPA: hypothetical protein [Caudoviricetes sp.]